MWIPGEIFPMHPHSTGPLGTPTHLLDGGLQGDMQVVHPRQLHSLVNALGCQRVSSENGVGVPGKQHEGDFCLLSERGGGEAELFWSARPQRQAHARPGESAIGGFRRSRDQTGCFTAGGLAGQPV